mgnify:CR=1 FL=1
MPSGGSEVQTALSGVQAVTTNLPGLVRFAKKAGVNQIEGYGVTPGEPTLLLR